MKNTLKRIVCTVIITGFALILLKPFVNYSIVAYAISREDSYIYLTDLWDSNKLLTKESSWKDARALRINQNEPGDLISLNIEGQQKYFLNGLFAHARSTLIFDISEYTQKGFDTFSSYIGVDTYAKANGNGVQFTISASVDNKQWVVLEQPTTIFKGNTDAKEIIVPIEGYNYLKLYVSEINNNNSSDHAVYANAMLFDKDKYTPRTDTKVSWISDLNTYDEELKKYSDLTILSHDDLEMKLLQRTLVKRMGYQIIQAYATSDDANKVETLHWLFTDKERLKTYITGGEPLGNYVNSLNVLTKLYQSHKDDLVNDKYTPKQREVFFKMMVAISLTHSGTVALWTTGANNTLVVSDPVKRYEAFKNLYVEENLPIKYEQTFAADTFESLTVEEMRWVVDARLSDEEIPWLNWYSSHLENTKYSGRNGMDPYTYIWYDDSFDWRYTDPKYYEANSTYCSPDIKNKFVAGYERGASCNDIYKLDVWGIVSNTPTKPRLWAIWEEDGVCGAISKTGENLNNAYGKVAAVTRQPAHAAYLIQTKTKNEDGTYISTWSIGNDVRGWALSSGTEKGERLPLNWGTTTNDYASNYNGSYVILAQRALDDFASYQKALEYTFIADMYEEDLMKQREIYRQIVGIALTQESTTVKNEGGIQYFNLDGWYGLIQTYLKDDHMTSLDYYKLSYEIMANLDEFPLAMNDMLNLINAKLNDHHKFVIDSAYYKILTELSKVPNNSDKYLQGQAVRQVAQYLLGNKEENVKFSFSGENANKIVLATAQPFEYSLNYSYNPETKEVFGDWIQVTEGNMADLTNQLNQINATNDIVVHILGDGNREPTSNSVITINIEKGITPKNLYANDLENQVIGTTSNMEWQIISEDNKSVSNNKWIKFQEKLPDLSKMATVLVRDGAHDTYLPSDYVALSFEEADEVDLTKVYVPISRLKVTASSRQNNNEHELKAIDGNANTYWHNLWSGADQDKWIQLEITDEDPISLSKIEYMPRQDSGTNGIFTKVKLEVSLTGEKDSWTTVDDNIIWAKDKSTKTYILDTPTLAKYVRLTAIESAGNFASAAMINLFENTTTRISVNDLAVSYVKSGFIYDGMAKEPEVTVRYNNQLLILNEDYKIEYLHNINAGMAQISLKGMGKYTGKKEFEFKIDKALQPLEVPAKEMFVDSSVTHLIYVPLPEDWWWEDYEFPLQPGKTVNVKAIYYGDDRNNYEITETMVAITQSKGNSPQVQIADKAKLSFDIATEDAINYDYFKNLLIISDLEDDQKQKELTVTLNQELTNWDGFTWNHIGTFCVGYTITDSDENKVDYTIVFTLFNSKIPSVEINEENFAVDIKEAIYNGSALTPKITIRDAYHHILTEDIDYEIVSYKNNINAGFASVTIKGIGLYSKEMTINFKIAKASVPSEKINDTMTVSYETSTLNDISLPVGWVWDNTSTKLQEGENKVKIIFVGDQNHERYEMEIVVVREQMKNTKQSKYQPDLTNPSNELDPKESSNSNDMPNNNDELDEQEIDLTKDDEVLDDNQEQSRLDDSSQLDSNTVVKKDSSSHQVYYLYIIFFVAVILLIILILKLKSIKSKNNI